MLPSPRAPALAATVLALVACGRGSSHELAPPTYEDDPAARAALVAGALDGWKAGYVLTWNGQRIGEARERFFASDEALGGYRFERSERVVVRREDGVARTTTSIVLARRIDRLGA